MLNDSEKSIFSRNGTQTFGAKDAWRKSQTQTSDSLEEKDEPGKGYQWRATAPAYNWLRPTPRHENCKDHLKQNDLILRFTTTKRYLTNLHRTPNKRLVQDRSAPLSPWDLHRRWSPTKKLQLVHKVKYQTLFFSFSLFAHFLLLARLPEFLLPKRDSIS